MIPQILKVPEVMLVELSIAIFYLAQKIQIVTYLLPCSEWSPISLTKNCLQQFNTAPNVTLLEIDSYESAIFSVITQYNEIIPKKMNNL